MNWSKVDPAVFFAIALILFMLYEAITDKTPEEHKGKSVAWHTVRRTGRQATDPPFDEEFSSKKQRDAWHKRNSKDIKWFDASKEHTRKNPQQKPRHLW